MAYCLQCSGKAPKGAKRILGGGRPTGVITATAKTSGSHRATLQDLLAGNNPFANAASSSMHPPKSHRAPKVDYKVRGSLPERPLLEGEHEILLRELKQDMVVPRTLEAKLSSWSTWQVLHTRWFSDDIPVLPLTEDKIPAIAAQMKK